jgi:farnesyl-diphosphate farnesyltransferase
VDPGTDEGPGMSSVSAEADDDWRFCGEALRHVSRSFAQPIGLLPPELARALTVGYLLCRVADTIEDAPRIDPRERDELFSLFQAVLRGTHAASQLAARFGDRAGSDAERTLMGESPRLMRVFMAQRPAVRAVTSRWVSEMTDGMRLYSRRAEHERLTVMHSLADLERYCYFVAGTVGHMVTELFVDAMGEPALEPKLRKHAEAFGLGLQMVNIVKDVTDDFSRGVAYIPRELCVAEGFEPELLLAPSHRAAALRAVGHVIARARKHLDAALEYALTIPVDYPRLRLFCLLPLWMAVETLGFAEGNEAIFSPHPLKIGRDVVGGIMTECAELVADDDALRQRFARRSRNSRHLEHLHRHAVNVPPRSSA